MRDLQAYPDIFNDVFGPVMRPFSSSHTAAPCRIGYVCGSLMDLDDVAKITIQIDPDGSFYHSLHLQHIDFALLSGASGHLPDDILMFSIKKYLDERNVDFDFVFEKIEGATSHSAAKVFLTSKEGKTVSALSKSVGGGLIEIENVNGYPYSDAGACYSILVQDPEEAVDGKKLSEAIYGKYTVLDSGCNTAEGLGRMFWFKTSDEVTAGEVRQLFDGQGAEAYVIKPVQHVILQKDRAPRLFGSFAQWRKLAEERGVGLDEIVIEYEMRSSGWTRERVLEYFRDTIVGNMHRTTHLVYTDPAFAGQVSDPIDPKKIFSSNRVKYLYQNEARARKVMGDAAYTSLKYAEAASLGLPEYIFIPGPMGMGGNLIYSALSGVRETMGYSDEDILRGVIVAAGVGLITFIGSEPGGTNMGCAGEQGICGAMASAAIAAMMGGTPQQIENAASMFLQISVGWPCDPQPGCKSQPCGSRSTITSVMSLVFAEEALEGVDAVFPFDEVLDVAYDIGVNLSDDIRGNSCGAHGTCPTAIARRKMFADSFKEKSKCNATQR